MSHRRIRKSRKSRKNRRILKNKSKRRNTRNTRRTQEIRERMRGGGDQEEDSKVMGTNYDPKYFKDLWGDYCHRHNKNQTMCEASDLCSYSYIRSKNRCANNYGDLETAEKRMMEEIARQKGGETTTTPSTTGGGLVRQRSVP
jgi:hypothetical protein